MSDADAFTPPTAMSRRELARAAIGAWLTIDSKQVSSVPSESSNPAPTDSPWGADFPVLSQRINGYPLAYLDSAATTHRPTQVLTAMNAFYEHSNANPGSALHTLARRAHEQYEAARNTVARFLNSSSDQIVWTKGTTEGINLVATAWARSILKADDEILLTIAEHASNLLPWRLVAEQTGARITYVDVDDEGRILIDDLRRKLSDRTRLFAFSHVSNVVGYVNPAKALCATARAAGVRVLIDAAQSAPHVAIDVEDLGCDFLVFSSHKILGPMGTGVLWVRRELLETMPPYQAGSNMAHEVGTSSQQFEHLARKFGAGTPNVAGAIGLAAALEYSHTQGRAKIQRHEADLTRHALDRLKRIPGLRLLGPQVATDRVPVFSFVLGQHASDTVLRHLDSRGIAVRAGDLAAMPLLRRFGVQTAVRASCYLYNQSADIDRLVMALHELALTRAVESRARSDASVTETISSPPRAVANCPDPPLTRSFRLYR